MFDALLNLDWIQQYGLIMAWLLLALLLLSGFGLPLPEDIPLLASGMLCHAEVVGLWFMIPATFVAVIGADCSLYFFGRRWGHHVSAIPLLRRYLTPDRLERAQLAFHNHGGKTLFAARFLPGIRAAVFFSAGVFKLPLWKMLAFDGSAALISVPALVLVGYFFATQIHRVKELTEQAQLAVAGGVVVAIAVVVAWKLMRRRRLPAVG